MKMAKMVQMGMAFVLALGLALGGVVSPAAAITTQVLCEGEGGTWVSDGANGICFIPTSLYSGYCPGFVYVVVVIFGGSPFLVGCGNSTDVDMLDENNFAYVGSIGSLCIDEGGIWYGELDGENGICTFQEGTSIALNDCGPGFDSVYAVVDDNILYPPNCVASSTGGGSGGADYPPYGRFGNVVQGETGAGSLSLGGPKNGSVSFDAGTCAGKCTVSPNLPGGAKASLPADAIATLYFRSTDTDGEPGSGTYTVCFAVGDLTSPVIYRYVGGAWVAQAVTISGGQVCASGSGDGAYALGGS